MAVRKEIWPEHQAVSCTCCTLPMEKSWAVQGGISMVVPDKCVCRNPMHTVSPIATWSPTSQIRVKAALAQGPASDEAVDAYKKKVQG